MARSGQAGPGLPLPAPSSVPRGLGRSGARRMDASGGCTTACAVSVARRRLDQSGGKLRLFPRRWPQKRPRNRGSWAAWNHPGTPGSPARAQLPTGRGASSWRGLPRVFAAAEYMACPGPGGRPCSNLMIRVGRASAGRFRDRQVTSGRAAAGMRAMEIGPASAPATERLGEGAARAPGRWPGRPAGWQARSGTGLRAGGGGPVCRSGETGAPLDCGTGPR